jgi:archaellum component FlaC
MRNFQLLTFLIALQLPSPFSYSVQQKVESMPTARSTPSDFKKYLAQNDSHESSVDTRETKPVEAVSEKLEAVSNPLGKASESIESISRPIESLSKPLESVSEPLSSVSQPLGSISKPVDSLKNSQESESQIEEGKEHAAGLDVNSIQGGKGEMGKEQLEVEKKYDSPDPQQSFEETSKESENVDVTGQHYDRIKGTKRAYCRWTDENGMIHIESGEKCVRK